MAAAEIKAGTGVTILYDANSVGDGNLGAPLASSFMQHEIDATTTNRVGIREIYAGTAGNLYTGGVNHADEPQGGVHPLASPTDFTDAFLLLHCKGQDAAVQSLSSSTGAFALVNSSSTSAEEAVFFFQDEYKLHPDYKPYVFNLSLADYAHKHTNLDIADITHVGLGIVGRAAGSSYGGISGHDNWALLKTPVAIGGNAPDTPGSIKVFTDYAIANRILLSESPNDNMHYFFSPLAVGDGATSTRYSDNSVSITFPSAPDFSSKSRAHIKDDDFGFRVNASPVDELTFSLCSYLAEGGTTFYWKSEGSSSATVSYSLCVVAGAGEVVVSDGHTFDGCIFDGCGAVSASQPSFTSSTFTNSAGVALTLSSDNGLVNSTGNIFKDNAVALEITVSGNCALDVTGETFSGNTTDIQYTGTGTLTVTASATQSLTTSATGVGGSIVVVQPTTTLTVNPDVDGCDVYIYTAGTQTILASGAGVNDLSYVWAGAGTVDIQVFKAGYTPYRQAGAALVDGTLNVTMSPDPVYKSGHGLAYSTDWTYNAGTKILTLVTEQDGRDFYSSMQDVWSSEAASNTNGLRNKPFPLQANGPDSMIFLNGNEAVSNANLKAYWIGAGVEYQDTNGTATAQWAYFRSSGSGTAGQTPEYQQQDGSGTTDAKQTGNIDEVVQTYGDGTHGNFDYRGHMVWKFQVNGFRPARVDVVNDINDGANLEPLEYSIAMSLTAVSAATGDPAVTGDLTITDHGATPVTWNSKDFSITIVDNGVTSGEEIMRELNYSLAQDATFFSKDPFNWPEMVLEAGGSYETSRGYTEGAQSSTLKGVRVLRGSDPHPDFTRFQADDGTYYVTPTVAGVSAPNLTAGWVELYNVTQDSLIESAANAGAYSKTWTDGTDATEGDEVRLRWRGVGKLPIQATVIVSADSTQQIITTPENDSVYTTYGHNGATITEFALDVIDVNFEITDPDNSWYASRLYAWYSAAMVSANGIATFWDTVRAINASNIEIKRSVIPVMLHNTKADTVVQADQIVITTDDGTSPYDNTGGGITSFFQGIGYTSETGVSGLTPAESEQLNAVSTFNFTSDEVESGESVKDVMKLLRAAILGEVSRDSETGDYVFLAPDGTTERVRSTTNDSGERTEVVVSPD